MIVERTTNAVAGMAIASPWWLPSLAEVSRVASLMLPILGATWLVVQIVLRIREHLRK